MCIYAKIKLLKRRLSDSITLNLPTKQLNVGLHHGGKLELMVLALMTTEKSLSIT